MDANAKADALLVSGDLVERIAYWKGAFYQYITECDRDPTLLKVAHTVGHIQLREIAKSFAALGGLKIAEWLLSNRENLTPIRVLDLLQEVESIARRGHQKLGGQLPSIEPPDPFPTLAEHRARVMILFARNADGIPLLSDDDLQRLTDDPTPVTDRFYTVWARLNQIPLPPMDQAEAPPTTTSETPPAGEQEPFPEHWHTELAPQRLKLVKELWGGKPKSLDSLHQTAWKGREVQDDAIVKVARKASEIIAKDGYEITLRNNHLTLSRFG